MRWRFEGNCGGKEHTGLEGGLMPSFRPRIQLQLSVPRMKYVAGMGCNCRVSAILALAGTKTQDLKNRHNSSYTTTQRN
jgi:hypothetical protein